MGETTRQAFVKLKPLCDLLMKAPNVERAIHVENYIETLTKETIQDLMEYILFPAIVHLQTNISNDVKLNLLNIIKSTISKTKIINIEFFNKLYLCIIFSIHDKQQTNLLTPMNEELKESVVQCLRYLILHSSMSVIELLYTRENAAKLSQSIYTCLSIAKYEKSPSLRVAAIEALITLSYVHDKADFTDVVLRSQVADIIMLFLPGIVSGLQEISQGNDIQNHKITVMAIRALGRIMALVMEDLPQDDKIPSLIINTKAITNNSTSDPLGMSLRNECHSGMEKHIKTVVRNQEWLNAASEKLQVPMQNLINLTKHEHYKVRRELNNAVSLILLKCSRNMNNNFAELVEVIIALSEDDSEHVKVPAEKSLNEINNIVTKNHKMRSIVEVLEERFYKLLTKLPRIIRMSEDATQLSYLNQLIGYLKLLGRERLPKIMSSVAHLRRLLLSLVYVVEFDYSNVTIIEENQLRSIEDSSCTVALPSWKRFKFIRDNTTEQKIISICKLLGTLGNLSILINSIFELITDMPQYRNELILLLNWILISTNDTAQLLYQQIIDYYIVPEFWYLPIQLQDNSTLKEIQNNIVLSCLLTEGLGLIATTLQNNYQIFLLKTLYLVIEKAGSGHSLCNQVGLNSLERIAKSQGHLTIADLIRANVDYFSYHVTMKLKRVEKNPGVLNVVSVVMKYSTLDLLPCLKEIVEDALIQLGANFQQANAYSLLKILYTFTICIKQMICIKNEENDDEFQRNREDIKEKIIKSVLEHCEAKKVSEEINNPDLGGTPEDILKELEEKETNDDLTEVDMCDENETKIIPPHVTIIENVMKRCLHFLPSKDISKSLLAMQTLQEGLYILESWSEQLLPIVHELWHPLVDRFYDSNILIINRAWQLLYTLAIVSKDFIRHRTLKHVSPALAKFLENSSKESCKKNLHDAYKFTQMFKLQKLLLTQLGIVAKHLKLHERELWKMLTLVESYLNSNQHLELQRFCINLYKNIADFNSDIVWVKCLSMWNSYIESIPDDETFGINNLQLNKDSNNKYRNNICEIMLHIDELMH